MSPRQAYRGCEIFDGETRRAGHALLVGDALIAGIVPEAEIPPGHATIDLHGGLIAPGFVDLQVNGGGGAMLNDDPSVATIRTICAAHLPFGTTSLLPTLITDAPDRTAAAIAAARAAIAAVPGVVGLHLEGPHLSLARKGAHDPALIRAMTRADLATLIRAVADLPSLLVTLAPESATNAQIRALAAAGATVSLGHTDAGYDAARAAFASGATAATHLFNAMSQLGGRTPGMVGATLDHGAGFAGLIADGVHVDPASIGIALRAKRGPGRIFLITDAMAAIGTDLREFRLNGRTIRREGGRLTLEDGTLAGADLDMISAVRFMASRIGLGEEEALRMASLYPAQLLGRSDEIGRLATGTRADFLLLRDGLTIDTVWQAGVARSGRLASPRA